MFLIRAAIENPIKTSVAVLLTLLFGMLAFFRVPIQLTPDVDRPAITVSTFWLGASPQEVEREIIDRQEEQLKSLDGLTAMESTASSANGSIQLEFAVGTDIDVAALKVSNKMDQVRGLPADAERPIISNVDSRSDAIAWFVITGGPGHEDDDIAKAYDFVDQEIKPRLERVPGVARINVFGGRERELQVVIDPERLAARGVTIEQIAQQLGAENRDYSAGDFDQGKRRYVVRTMGDYHSPEEVGDVVIASPEGIPIHVRDVAEVQLDYRKAVAFVRSRGRPTLAFNAQREAGSNVLEVMAGLQAAVNTVEQELLIPRGLKVDQAYDETTYINDAIGLVRSNLFVGGTIALIILLLFLRSIRATLVIALSIPISVVATFLVMQLMGRSLNVISLAGLSFAVGMVVDNGIVVLENIFRHLELGKTRARAALEGALEVWGAVLASTLTTIAVFLPVVFVQEEAGQLFRDIAIAVCAAVGLSLIVSITVIPAFSARILRGGQHTDGGKAREETASRPLAFSDRVAALAGWIAHSTRRRLLTVTLLAGIAIGGSYLLMPKAEYLPTGNRNLVIGILMPPAGYNLGELRQMGDHVEAEMLPLLTEAPQAALPAGGLTNFFFVGSPGQVFMGAVAADPMRVKELAPKLLANLRQIPGTFGIARQTSLFSRRGQGRSINVDLRGPELETLIGLGGRMYGMLKGALPEAQIRPIPSLDLSNPEVHVRPDRHRLAKVGLTHRALAFAVNALVDGVKVTDYRLEGREIDLVVTTPRDRALSPEDIAALPIYTPSGVTVNLGSVAEVMASSGPTQINHSERQRVIQLSVSPPETYALEEAMDRINLQVIAPLKAQGAIPPGVSIALSGTADDLTRTRDALLGNFLMALLLTYLLLAGLFESWAYPLVILFSVPLAALGGFLGLSAVNLFIGYQAMDVLTMLGFVIMVGIVVNNAILIVHQSLNLMRNEGLSSEAAVRESVRTRVRPIFMSTLTSIGGMLPLVLFPGAGSELYRGLGSVVVGGLALSSIFTLGLVPALFILTLDARRALGLEPPSKAEAVVGS